MNNKIILSAVSAAVALALAGCGGGGGTSTSSTTGTSRSYTLPTEISAVPASTSTTTASLFSGLRAASTLPSSSDYSQAETAKYVEEHTLDQFSIIGQVMKALAQTHATDSANQTGTAYKAMVAWEDENNGVSTKTLEPWVVKSEVVSGTLPDGSTGNYNKIQAWIEEADRKNPGKMHTLRAEFDIYTGATFDTDGSVLTYGEWDLNVSFASDNSEYFVANARVENGTPVMKINAYQTDWFSRAVLYRTGTSGYGKVEYPDYSSCMSPSCVPGTASASYAYNADYLAVNDGATISYKDRASKVEMTHRYGLFYANADSANGIAAGDSIQKHKSFGFPVTYTDANGTQHAYYGAWQGRHQLWGSNGTVPAGTVVTREDFNPNATPETYTVSSTFNGSFTKRTLVDGSPDDINGIVAETFTNKHVDLFYNSASATKWQYCDSGWVQFGSPNQCIDFGNGSPKAFSDFTSFTSLKPDARKNVNISHNGTNYVYLDAADGNASFTVAGFYPATQGQNGWTSQTGGAVYSSTAINGDQMNVDVGGSIYIQYTGNFTTGTGWVQKKLQSFDTDTWTPTFGSPDIDFTPEQGREYYINSNGVNYVVRRVAATNAASDYQVQLELQSTANPSNVSTILPASTDHLGIPWRPELKLMLDTNPANTSTFMNLVYKVDDPTTPTVETTTTIYTNNEWGLQAYNASNQPLDASDTVVAVDGFGVPTGSTRPAQFNWEYSANGGWGSQQYLIDASSNYKLLSDPIFLTAQSFSYSYQTATKSLALQYDGWLHGLPDLYRDLQDNNWTMTTALSQKIINIPAGTQVTDNSNVTYYIKPLEVSVFLSQVTAADIATAGKTAPDVTQADSLDVTTSSTLLPSFTDTGMSLTIPTADVKYSEGEAV